MAFTGSGQAGNGPNDVPRDRHKRYLIPRYPLTGPMETGAEPIPGEGMMQPYTRVSTIAKAMADQFGLTKWQLRMAIKGISIRPDLYALTAATRIDDTGQLDQIVEQAKEAAKAKAGANLGTALHAFTDQVDAGEDPDIPEPWNRDIAAYQQGLKAHGIEIIREWRERRVVLPQIADGKAAGTAGTLDSIVLWNGRPTVADLKTGKDPLKYGAGEIAVQEGCYANAWASWDGEAFYPMPDGLRTDVALVFHLLPGAAQLDIYVVDISGAMESVDLALKVRAWRGNLKNLYTLLTPGELPEIGVLEGETQPDSTLAMRASLGPASVPDDDPELSFGSAEVLSDPALAVLAPLAGPGERGCSVCGRKGHRKGSAKCLGENDPAKGTDPIQFSESGAEVEDVWCRCTNRAAGWKADPTNPDGPWVCGDCGLPSKAGMIDGSGKPLAETASGYNNTVAISDGPTARAAATVIAPDDEDPFADDPEPDLEASTWVARIAEAQDKADIRSIRAAAAVAGEWTEELLKAGLARIEELARKG